MRMLLFFLMMLVSGVFAVETIYLSPGAKCGIFTTLRGEWSRCSGSVFISYGQDALEIRGECIKPEGSNVRVGKVSSDEMAAFAGEVFEFQVAPAGQGGVYYHFAVNTAGNLYSAKCRDYSWNPVPAVEKKVTVDGRKWNIDLRIPYSCIGEDKPYDGEEWRANFGWSSGFSDGTSEVASVSGASDFHDVSQYAKLVFGRRAPSPNITLDGIEVNEKHFGFSISSDVKLDDNTRVALAVDGKNIEGLNITYAMDGKGLSAVLPQRKGYIPLKGIECIEIKVSISDDVVRTFSALSPWRGSGMLELDSFYYVKGSTKVGYSHELEGEARIRVFSPAGKKMADFIAAPKGEIEIPEDCPLGSCRVEISNGIISTSRVFVLVLSEYEDFELTSGVMPSLTIREDGCFLRGGKPSYLIGMSQTAKSFLKADKVFNMRYSRFGARDDAALSIGLPTGRLIRKPETGKVFSDKNMASVLSSVARAPVNQPAIRRICYESQIRAAVKNEKSVMEFVSPLPFIERYWTELKKARPDLIFSMHTDSVGFIRDASRLCDVFEVSVPTSSYAKNLVIELDNDIARMKMNMHDRNKPVIYWLGGTIPDKVSRTAEELRCAVWLCVLRGMRGNIFHMGHGFLPEERTRLWSLISGICGEIEAFYPDFASGTDVTYDIGDVQEGFAWKAVRNGDRTMLMVVNTRASENKLDVIIPGRRAKYFGNGLKAAVRRRHLRDTFTPYEPKLYILE